MKHIRKPFALLLIPVLAFMLCVVPTAPALAWTEQAHMAMGLAAGFGRFHMCGAVDLAGTVAAVNDLWQTDGQAHFYNAPAEAEITAADVRAQLEDIGKSRKECPEGYLLGAILHTARLCREKTETGAFDDEYYAILLHYVADLTQPLHMSVYDDFNREFHFACDDILTDKGTKYPVLSAIALAAELAVEEIPVLTSEADLTEAVAGLAARSHRLAAVLRKEQRIMTREEALSQISRAAALGRAIMVYCGKIGP